MFDTDLTWRWLRQQEARICRDLVDFIDIETVTPHESRCFDWLTAKLEELDFEVVAVPLSEELRRHPRFTPHPQSRLGPDRYNLRARPRHPDPRRPSILFNSHVDVVPASPDFAAAFAARVSDGRIVGRGACDTKNNILMLLEAIRYLRESGRRLASNVWIDLVIEEEIGGNGTLACATEPLQVDGVVVLEPTDLQVFCGHRGCLTWTIEVTGRSVHMGSDTTGVNAIEKSVEVMRLLKDLEARLLHEAQQDLLFRRWPRPVQLNIGRIEGGEWSGSVPERCVVRGDLGFLPRYSIDDARQLIRRTLSTAEDPWIREHTEVRFDGLRNEAYVIDPEAPLVKRLLHAVRELGVEQDSAHGWKVSCDARLYHKLWNVTTVIFGSGSLDEAHSSHESVAVDELLRGAAILACLLGDGARPEEV